MTKDIKNVGLRVTPELYLKIRYYCLNNNISLQKYIIKLIERDLFKLEVEQCIAEVQSV
jgi:hypothetical protein